MKNLKHLLFVAALSFIFVGCGKSIVVSFESDTIEVGTQGGTVTVALSSNGDWTIDATPDWITVSPMSGNGDVTLTLNVLVNETPQTRTGEIKVSTKDNTAVLNVQQGSGLYLSVSPTHMELEEEGGEFVVAVSSNISWMVSSLPDWVTCSQTHGEGDASVTVTVAPFDSKTEVREVEVTFGNTEIVDVLRIVQVSGSLVGTLVVTPQIVEMAYSGESKPITVMCDEAWSATIDGDWVTLNKTQGEGNDELTVTVIENTQQEERGASIEFASASGNTATIKVIQEAAPNPHYLNVSPTTLSFSNEGGNQEVAIECDEAWTVNFNSDWATVSALSGSGNGTLTITVDPNPLQQTRSLRFYVNSGSLGQSVVVDQEPGTIVPYATFNPNVINVAYTGEVVTLNLTSNIGWTLRSSSWITLMTTSGDGDATFDIIVENNTTSEVRSGYVEALFDGQVMGRVDIIQEGRPSSLATNITELNVGPEGGTYNIQLTANQAWGIGIDVDWIYCTPMEGVGDTVLEVIVKPMDFDLPRTGHIIIKTETESVVVTVNQQ